MAADQIVFSANTRKITERSSYTVTARFRNRSSVADVTPTNVRYRLDSRDGAAQIADWTSATASTSVPIVITSAQNAMLNDTRSFERHVLTVASDYGLSTQYIDTFDFEVRNLQGLP